MKKSMFLAAVVAAAVSTVAQADNTAAQKAVAAVPPVKSAKPAPQMASKATRLSDAELDEITAGKAFHLTGGGLTFVLNPGKAKVGPEGPKFTRNNFVCINCF